MHLGPAAGWMAPSGLARWERELSFVARADLTEQLGKTLRATLPWEQIPPKRLPLAYRAVEGSPFLPVASKLAADVRAQGVRVHTVGVDRLSADFFYFAEGGPGEAVRVQGNLVGLLEPTLEPTSTNEEIRALQRALVDRLLAHLSGGVVSELAVELADALPRLSRDGTGLDGTDMDAFEEQARTLANRAERWESAARAMAHALRIATQRGERNARVPMFGEAREEVLGSLRVELGGKAFELPAWKRWTVSGQPLESAKRAEPKVRPAPTPVASPPPPLAASERAARARPRGNVPQKEGRPDARVSPSSPPGSGRPKFELRLETLSTDATREAKAAGTPEAADARQPEPVPSSARPHAVPAAHPSEARKQPPEEPARLSEAGVRPGKSNLVAWIIVVLFLAALFAVVEYTGTK